MPSRACAAFGCPNNSRKTVGVSYFRPRDDIIKQNWVKACPNGMKQVKNFYICSEHFHESEKKSIGYRMSLLDHTTAPTIWKFARWCICIQSFQKQSFFYDSLCPSVCPLSAKWQSVDHNSIISPVYRLSLEKLQVFHQNFPI